MKRFLATFEEGENLRAEVIKDFELKFYPETNNHFLFPFNFIDNY